jgi:hypothetical protein
MRTDEIEYSTTTTATTTIIMVGRLPDDVVNRIVVCLKSNEEVPAIEEATKVAKSTIYRIRLNLDIWGTPYPPSTVILGRPRGLLPYQEEVIYKSL